MDSSPENSVTSLTNLNMGETAFIAGLRELREDQRDYLTNTGFVPGESVTPVLLSPSGSCTAYRLGGCGLIALRDAAADKILVTGEFYE